MPALDWTLPLITLGGAPAVLLGRLPEPHDGQPMVVRVFTNGQWNAETYTLDGVFFARGTGVLDLINDPNPIRVHPEFPPIPTRDFDYRATRDSYEPGGLIGRGPTPDLAIADLLTLEAEA